MSYSENKETLVKRINKEIAAYGASTPARHSCSLEVDTLSQGQIAVIHFPGYKWEKEAPDFRVSIKSNGKIFTPSHTNIIADIANKVERKALPIKELEEALYSICEDPHHCCNLDYKVSLPPSKDLIQRFQEAHNRLDKSFSIISNEKDLHINDLLIIIKWLMLQEDINYPMSKGYEGRTMPAARYLEAISAMLTPELISLEKVIKRTISHKERPEDLNNLNINYKRLRKLNQYYISNDEIYDLLIEELQEQARDNNGFGNKPDAVENVIGAIIQTNILAEESILKSRIWEICHGIETDDYRQ